VTRIRVGAAVLNQTPLDWRGNSRRIVEAIELARLQKVSLLCLPELCVSGYNCEDAFLGSSAHRTALEVLIEEIVPATTGMIVLVGLPFFQGNGLFNAGCLLVDGRIAGLTAKQHLAGSGIHDEPRWFRPWPAGETVEVEVGDSRVPLGDVLFDCGGVRVGVEICEDAWAAHRPGAELAARGADVILNPSASHFAFGKIDVRRRFVLEGSRAFGVSYVYANLVGNESGRAIYDGGALIATAGTMLAEGPRFSYVESAVTTAVVDIDATRMVRAHASGLAPVVKAPEGLVRFDHAYPELDPTPATPERAAWESSEHLKGEELARAVSLGLFDYARKSRSKGFVVSLSGGADSAAVCCLVSIMTRLATGELGIDEVRRRLGVSERLADAASSEELVQGLLTCVYQGTKNSSKTTRDAARAVAEGLSARHFVFEVDEVVAAYVSMASGALGRPLTWEQDDLALQNIQARSRAPSVWLLANIEGALLLATSNRSEAAVGYATMDGDTCGGVSPIAGIDKSYLRTWLAWLEAKGVHGLGPMPFLRAVNEQQPTAELRPQSEGQTDEQDLMPYDILNAIEQAAIRDRLGPVDAFKLVSARFEGASREDLGIWVERFFRLWARNQWKRERYAPSFHLDDENLDPKTWCRFPILSGGYERELEELRAYLEG